MPQMIVPALTVVLGGGAVAAVAANVIYYLGATVVTSAAARALAPKPRGLSGPSGQLLNVRQAAAPQEYVYGQVRKGGVITFMETTGSNNQYLHMVIVLAGHPVEDIGDIYVNDEVVTIAANFVTGSRWNSKIRIKKYDGTQTTADADLVAETSFSSSGVGHGIAYLYIRLEYDQSIFSGGLPTFTAVVKGKKVADTSSVAQTYPASANAALVIRDYLRSAYGLADTLTNDAWFGTAANDCDDDINLTGSGTQKRYTIDGVITADQQINAVLQDMVNACNGTLYFSDGEWKLRVGVYDAPIASFGLDDIRSDIAVSTRFPRRDSYNRVIGKFVDASAGWIEGDFPPVTSSAFLSEDGGIENTLDLALPYVTNGARAQRVAKQTLFRMREQMTLTADFSLKALDVAVGDIVEINIPQDGFVGKEFEVSNWRFTIDPDAGAKVTMVLRETSQAAFDWNAEEQAIISNNTTLLPYFLGVPVGLSLAAVAVTLSEKLINRLDITVTSSAPEYVSFVEVEYKPSSGSTWLKVGTGELGSFFVDDVDRANYDVRARSINPFGVRGDWAYFTNFNADATAGPPADVTGFNFEVVGNQLTLNWQPVPDLDLSYYEIRHSLEQTGASWGGSTSAVAKVARPGVSVSLPIKSGTYHIRSYDKGKVPSEAYTSLVVPATYLPSYANILTQTEDPSFSGSKTGLSVVSSALRLTSPVDAGDFGTYDFSAYIDTGAARLVWARVEAIVSRADDGAGLFDDLQGLFDSLPGLFDNLNGGDFGDHNVEFYVSTTNDNPAGTPTWGAYQRFRSGNFYGRAFRFRAILKTEADDITPNITGLDAIVEY